MAQRCSGTVVAKLAIACQSSVFCRHLNEAAKRAWVLAGKQRAAEGEGAISLAWATRLATKSRKMAVLNKCARERRATSLSNSPLQAGMGGRFCPIAEGNNQMKKLVFATAMLALASTEAIAGDVWVQHSDLTCNIPQYSLADTFKMFSLSSSSLGLPQPQVDYTSGAAVGATIIHYFSPNTRQLTDAVFWDSRADCEAGRARAQAWIAAGKPPL